MEPERRYLSGVLGIEERSDEPTRITGIAPPWDSASVDLGGFQERFLPGSFAKYLTRDAGGAPADVVAKFNHSDLHVLGRTTNGTLDLAETDKGLAWRATPPAGTATTVEVLTLIRGGYIHGSSFAFSITDPAGEKWDQDPAGNVTRTISEAALYDVSPVTHAAYPSATVGVRSLERWKANLAATRAADKPLTISIDYDDTFTAAPGLWRSFIADATARGNRVVCITRREDTEANRHELRVAFADLEVPRLLLTGPDQQKRAAAKAAGLSVDIWIDDRPEAIPERRRSAVLSLTLAGARAVAAAAILRHRIHAG
jgi:HK97 family phage prohead protease